VRVYGEVISLSAGLHGFHVHELGDLTNGCTSAGAHLNKFAKNHGGPKMLDRHLGDLGNIEANLYGIAKFDFYDWLLRLDGPNSIIGRSVVVHQNPDDLGLGKKT
jgi:Cu-Zn family superoxide dismutase